MEKNISNITFNTCNHSAISSSINTIFFFPSLINIKFDLQFDLSRLIPNIFTNFPNNMIVELFNYYLFCIFN